MTTPSGFPISVCDKNNINWTVDAVFYDRQMASKGEHAKSGEFPWLPYDAFSTVATCKLRSGRPARVVLTHDDVFTDEKPHEGHPGVHRLCRQLAAELQRAIADGLIEPGTVYMAMVSGEVVSPATAWRRIEGQEDTAR